MSRHQDVRNLDYQDELDDYEGYSDEENNELSPEDQAAMKQGTADVRAALGLEVSKVTTAQIEEALWHYYYDVDKSVAYLISKFIDPPKKTAKAPQQKPNGMFPNSTSSTATISAPSDFLSSSSRLAEKARAMADPRVLSSLYPRTRTSLTPRQGDGYLWQAPLLPETSLRPPQPFSHLFRDMPWGNIPRERQTVFIPPPRLCGGLLGGSGTAPKMSKLQQLAAARKKKAEEKAAQEKIEQTRTQMTELSVNETPKAKETTPLVGPFGKRQKTSESTAEGRNPLPPVEPKRPEIPGRPFVDGADEEDAMETESAPAPERARPSAFAQTLCGNDSDTPKRKRLEFFTLPYMDFAPSAIDAFSKPSPDDVVLAAQAKAGKKTAVNQTKKKGSSTDAVASGVGALKIEDVSLPKSKNLDVISEFNKNKGKKTASFVVVGHVDAGKSTMMGRLLLDLKVVDQRTVDKLRAEAEKIGKTSFALAWVLDQRADERNRGVTIDIATNRFETDTTAFTILDAPGHRDFIPNMIAGASQADFAILVIDASTGAFESGLKGQTREHSLLIRSMGVARIIVAINKLDTVGWSQERFDEIKHQVSGFLSTTGFQAKNISFVPVSGLHGDNLVNKTTDPAASWYTGPTLVQELENSEPNARALAKPLRMSIAEMFPTPQSSVSVSGRVDAGSLQTGDAILIQPSGEKAYIKSLEVDDSPADWAVAGQTAVLHLSSTDPVHVRVGDIICDPKKPIQCSDTFTLKALAFDFLMPMPVDVHRGRLHAPGRIEVLAAVLDKVTGTVTKKKPKIVKPATVARVVVKLESKVPMEAGQRVVLRSGGETVAAGLLE